MTKDSTASEVLDAHHARAMTRDFTDKAAALYEEVVNEFKVNLDYESRVNAGKDEQILQRHVEAARDSMLSTGIGKAVDIAVVWLLPIGFCLWGIAGSGFVKVFNGETVESGSVVAMLIGALSLGAAAALYIKGTSLKLWFQRKANAKAVAASRLSAPNLPPAGSSESTQNGDGTERLVRADGTTG